MVEADVASTEENMERGDVTEEGTKAGFKEETKVQGTVSHTLRCKGFLTGLAAHQISPLDNNNGDEEGTLSMGQGFFRNMADTWSFNIARLERDDGMGGIKPHITSISLDHVFFEELTLQSRKNGGIETVIVENNKVGEETSNGLDDTDLEVGEYDKLGGDQTIGARITRGSFHDIGFCVFVSERDGWNHVRTQVNAQNQDGGQRQRNLDKNEKQEGGNFRNVGR